MKPSWRWRRNPGTTHTLSRRAAPFARPTTPSATGPELVLLPDTQTPAVLMSALVLVLFHHRTRPLSPPYCSRRGAAIHTRLPPRSRAIPVPFLPVLFHPPFHIHVPSLLPPLPRSALLSGSRVLPVAVTRDRARDRALDRARDRARDRTRDRGP